MSPRMYNVIVGSVLLVEDFELKILMGERTFDGMRLLEPALWKSRRRRRG